MAARLDDDLNGPVKNEHLTSLELKELHRTAMHATYGAHGATRSQWG